MSGKRAVPNGMLTQPIQAFGWKTYTSVDSDQIPTSIHVVPHEQFVHSVDMEATCLCGPDVVYHDGFEVAGRVIPWCYHFALDPRYYEEEIEEDADTH